MWHDGQMTTIKALHDQAWRAVAAGEAKPRDAAEYLAKVAKLGATQRQSAKAIGNFIERYLSFEGRLARLPFIGRNIFIGVLAAALSMASIPFFVQGGLWWWVGLLEVVVALALLGVGVASLTVRRLHDLGFSGYHAIWVGVAQTGWGLLHYGPPKVVLAALPLAAIGAWVTLWAGNAAANRFGE